MSLMSLVSASLDSQFLISEKNPFSFLFYLLLSRFVFQVSFVSLSLSLLVHRPLILFVSISSGFTFPSLASSSFPLALRRDSSKERSEERITDREIK